MKLRLVVLLLGASLFCSKQVISQELGTKYQSSIEAITEGVRLHENGEYREAIKIYDKVGVGDTLYTLALYELAFSAQLDQQYQKAVETTEKLINLDSPYRMEAMILQAQAYEKLEKYTDAEASYTRVINEYGHSHRGNFERAGCYRNQKKWKEAIAEYEASAQLNNLHGNTHINFGLLAAECDQPALAIMAMYYGLIVNNNNPDFVLGILTVIEQVGNGTYEKTMDVPVETYNFVSGFGDLNELVNSKVALAEKYKGKVKGNYIYMKQLQLICEQMPSDVETSSPLVKFYMDFYKKMWAEGQFEGMMVQPLVNISGSNTQSLAKKYKKKVDAFVVKATAVIEQETKSTKYTRDGKELEGSFYFSNNELTAIGSLNSNNEPVGTWYYYHNNGEVKNIYQFVNGKADGLCRTFYDTGVIMSEENYSNGKLDGPSRAYNLTGIITSESNYSNGEQKGEGKSYHFNGALEYSYEVTESGEIPVKRYTERGLLSNEMKMLKGEPIGDITFYLPDGKPNYSLTFKDGKTEGSFISHFSTGEKAAEGRIEKGLSEGSWKYFYKNGNLNQEGNYKADEKTGEWKSYSYDGKLTEINVFKNGKLDGLTKLYDDNEKLLAEIEYKSGKASSFKYFSESGSVIKEAKSASGKVYVENYNELRIKTSEGSVDRENRVGEWKFYYANGTLKEIANYKNGELDGKSVTYHENGKPDHELVYVDGQAQGYYKKFTKYGVLKEEGYYEDGKLHGPSTRYYNEGELSEKAFYWKGKKNGQQFSYRIDGSLDNIYMYHHGILLNAICFDKNGKETKRTNLSNGSGPYDLYNVWGDLTLKSNLLYGSFDGKVEEYFSDGKLRIERNYFNGMLTGTYKVYSPAGWILEEGSFVEGEKEGVWKYYNMEDGKLDRTVEMRGGERNGKYTSYYKTGEVYQERLYKDDLRDGTVKIYAPDKTLMIQFEYKLDVLISYTYMGTNGKLKESIPVKDDSGTMIAYYPSGKKSYEFTLKNGESFGTFDAYLPSGKIYTEYKYNEGYVHDAVIENHPNGQKAMEGVYKNGDETGNFKWYHDNGKLACEANFVSGILHGAIKYFDKSGKLITEGEYHYGEFKRTK